MKTQPSQTAKTSKDQESAGDRLAQLEQRFAASEREIARMRRRLSATWGIAFAGVVGAFVLGLTPAAQAQYGVTLQSLQNQINALTPRVAAVETKTQFQSVSGTTTRFTGTNVQIVSGAGATDATVNGLGNLIVGYNEAPGSGENRTGSHNLILGFRNNYSSFGGFVAGAFNTVSGPFASISGGYLNEASGIAASISSGEGNLDSGFCTSISSGLQNTASGQYASVSGGLQNTASASYASVNGGAYNTASGQSASVSGGAFRSAAGQNDWRAGTLFQDQ